MHFLFRHLIKGIPWQLTVPQGQANLNWLCISVTSEESDFPTVAGSAERHLLHPLFDSSCAAHQPKGATQLPLLQRFGESLATAPPLQFISISPYLCGNLGMLTGFHPRSSSQISPCNFHAVKIIYLHTVSIHFPSVSSPLSIHSVGRVGHADHRFFLLKCNVPFLIFLSVFFFPHIMILICEG